MDSPPAPLVVVATLALLSVSAAVACLIYVWFDNRRMATRHLMTPAEYERLNEQRRERPE